MSAIVPAVLPSSRRDLEDKIGRYANLVESVQIDIIDGVLAGPASWPYADGAEELARLAARGTTLPFFDRLKFDIDLMVRDPEKIIGSWIALGATRITVHIESTNYPARVIEDFKNKYGHDRDFTPDLLSFGFALNVETDPAVLEAFIDDIDYVQFMGIARIGRQGEPFDKRVIDRIKGFRKKHPTKTIQVDGGVSNETAPLLLQAGVDRLIVGSALLYAPDTRKELQHLQDLTEKYGRYE